MSTNTSLFGALLGSVLVRTNGGDLGKGINKEIKNKKGSLSGLLKGTVYRNGHLEGVRYQTNLTKKIDELSTDILRYFSKSIAEHTLGQEVKKPPTFWMRFKLWAIKNYIALRVEDHIAIDKSEKPKLSTVPAAQERASFVTAQRTTPRKIGRNNLKPVTVKRKTETPNQQIRDLRDAAARRAIRIANYSARRRKLGLK